jgi:uncharacterized membrane protein
MNQEYLKFPVPGRFRGFFQHNPEKEINFMAAQQAKKAKQSIQSNTQANRAPAQNRSQQDNHQQLAQEDPRQFAPRNTGKEQIALGLGLFSIGLGLAEVLAPKKVSKLIGVRGKHDGLLRLFGLREITAGIGILTQKKPTGWLWSRVVGDAMDLAFLGNAMSSPKSNRTRVALATAAVAGVTALDIANAQQFSSSSDTPETPVRVKSVTINRSPEEVYQFWRNFQNLPRFMNHLESVQITNEKQSHWTARGPAGTTVEWDAEIIEDIPNQLIAWRSTEGSDIENSGSVRFAPAPGGRGTRVTAEIQYAPPGGAIGVGIAKLFGEEPKQQMKDDLYLFKQVIETGEVVHSDASIHAGPHPAQPSVG